MSVGSAPAQACLPACTGRGLSAALHEPRELLATSFMAGFTIVLGIVALGSVEAIAAPSLGRNLEGWSVRWHSGLAPSSS